MSRLVCVDPIFGDSYETADYRRCDFCYQSACDDIWSGLRLEHEWRLFFEVIGEDGLIVCEHCLHLLDEEG